MKILKLTSCILLVLALSGCRDWLKQKPATATEQATETTVGMDKFAPMEEQLPEEQHFGDFTVLKYNYMFQKGDGHAKAAPEDDAAEIFQFLLGDSVAVVGHEAGWSKVLCFTIYGWDKRAVDTTTVRVGYIRDADFGKASDLKLSTSDLTLLRERYNGEVRFPLLEGDTIRVEEISKAEFDAMQPKQAFGLDTLDTGVTKKDGTLRIPCLEKELVFEDRSYEKSGESMAEYTYLGMWRALGLHVIMKGGYDSSEVYIYDTKTGCRVGVCDAIPVISPDGKYIIDINWAYYDDSTEFALQQRDVAGVFEELCRRTFVKWAPAFANDGSYGDYFFGRDGAFYVRILSQDMIAESVQQHQELWQYLKITINL